MPSPSIVSWMSEWADVGDLNSVSVCDSVTYPREALFELLKVYCPCPPPCRPTSGLDARAAAIVMRAVRNTVNTGRTVVCTIHQPSIDIFDVSTSPAPLLLSPTFTPSLLSVPPLTHLHGSQRAFLYCASPLTRAPSPPYIPAGL